MGLFDFFKRTDINAGVALCKETPGAVLLDVRTTGEYSEGHIPSAVNVPVQDIERVNKKIAHKGTAIFTYCLSGARSRQAAALLKSMGYTNVTDIGGISRYSGTLERTRI